MARSHHRESSTLEPFDAFDRAFDQWMRLLPMRRPAGAIPDWRLADMIQVDEYHEDGTLVVRADLAGIDPEKDVELTVSDGMLHIEAERRQEEETEKRGYLRKELRYGSFARTIPLPDGVTEDDVTASYKDGILEIRVPAPEPSRGRKIAIATS